MLWNGGISFGGVVSFIFADLIIIATFYATMVAAGYVIELVFTPLGLVPTGPRHANVGQDGITWNYTTWLNIIFFVVAGALVYRFIRTGGWPMLKMMGGNPEHPEPQRSGPAASL